MEERRKTKIIASLGPSSEGRIGELAKYGVDVFRTNFSHASHDWHRKVMENVRRAAPDCGTMCDIQGPKIRTGAVSNPFVLKRGDEIEITPEKVQGTRDLLTINYPRLVNDLDQGDVLFINDGIIKLEVLNKSDNKLGCVVKSGGLVSSRKGCNIPSKDLSVSVPTEKDVKDLKLISKIDPEFLAISFVREKEDVERIRDLLDDMGNSSIKLISKIERPSAVQGIDDIIGASDGIMIARGDLGVEIPPQEVPEVQKKVIKKCNKEGVAAIVATQMLESMVGNRIPTRAEANDVFNAVLDGADAVLLSNETSVGKYPVESVGMMSDIITHAEKMMPTRDPEYFDSTHQTMIETMGHACFTMAREFSQIGYRGRILAITDTGYSARMISKYRPHLGIIGLTPDPRTARELKLTWGVDPVHSERIIGENVEERVQNGIMRAHSLGFLNGADHVLVVLSSIFMGDYGFYSSIYDMDEFLKRINRCKG